MKIYCGIFQFFGHAFGRSYFEGQNFFYEKVNPASILYNFGIVNPLKMREKCVVTYWHSTHTLLQICFGFMISQTVHNVLWYYQEKPRWWKWERRKNLIYRSFLLFLTYAMLFLLYNGDTSELSVFINVKTWAGAAKQIDAYENEGITQWYRMTSLIWNNRSKRNNNSSDRSSSSSSSRSATYKIQCK